MFCPKIRAKSSLLLQQSLLLLFELDFFGLNVIFQVVLVGSDAVFVNRHVFVVDLPVLQASRVSDEKEKEKGVTANGPYQISWQTCSMRRKSCETSTRPPL